MTYFEKLKDPRWQKKRLEVLAAANWTCFKGHEPWDYAVFHLQALCEDCHKRISDLDKEIHECIALLEEYDKDRLHGYIEAILASNVNGLEWDDCPMEMKSREWAKGLGEFFGIPSGEIINLAERSNNKLKYSDLLKLHHQFSSKGDVGDELGSTSVGVESGPQSESKVGSDGNR